MPGERPSPLLVPLRILLALTAVATFVTLLLVGLSSCHHAGNV